MSAIRDIWTDPQYARAFNRGSDARLAGRPLADNPYARGEDLWAGWLRGWRDVDEHYAEDARRPYLKLKPVRED